MPSLRAGRPKDDYWHEVKPWMKTARKTKTVYQARSTLMRKRVLDDFFDKFGGGTSKTQEENAALMADEKNEETFNTKKWLGDSGASSHI